MNTHGKPVQSVGVKIVTEFQRVSSLKCFYFQPQRPDRLRLEINLDQMGYIECPMPGSPGKCRDSIVISAISLVAVYGFRIV